MSKFRNLLLGSALSLIALPAFSQGLGLGREALPEEIDAWDVAVLPDGTGLRPGSGSVEEGDDVFYERCASCHGDFAEGLGSWPALAGGMGTLTDQRPVKTVGSYWPHLSTLFDYVHRSMPFGSAQTLTIDETYAITAYILYSNGLVEDDFVLSHENFLDVALPNADGFYEDDRPETEYTLFSAEPCMSDCRDAPPTVTRRAVDLGVTPTDEDGRPAGTIPATLVVTEATDPADDAEIPDPDAAPEVDAGEIVPDPAPEPETDQAAAAETVQTAAAPDPAMVADGERVFRKCAACHQVGDGARNGVGPHLNDVYGHTVGAVDDFAYSNIFKQLASDGTVWDHDNLSDFLENPRNFARGTKMSFAGLRSEQERDAVIAYLQSLTQ
ncbi:MAG: c-type cytochrome [Paracoccus sp. (in: a-proteobacteria)]|nr:c-type cytochrome [Paracoccus sp. (in: a-proteobacteria)]